jgi:hypothetical protein
MGLISKFEACRISEKNRSKVVIPELEMISEKIKKAAEEGYYNVTVAGRIHFENKIRLHKAGYKIKQGRLNYNIKWGDY